MDLNKILVSTASATIGILVGMLVVKNLNK